MRIDEMPSGCVGSAIFLFNFFPMGGVLAGAKGIPVSTPRYGCM